MSGERTEKRDKRELKDAPERLAFERNPVWRSNLSAPLMAGPAPALARTGFFAERSIAALNATCSNIDVHIRMPASWVSGAKGDAAIRVYSLTEGVRTLQLSALVSAMSLVVSDAGTSYSTCLSVRGHPSQGWLVTGAVATGGSDHSEPAVFTLIGWGTESTPERVGEDPASSVTPAAFPVRGSALMGLRASRWRPVGVGASGELLVTTSPGGSLTVKGDNATTDGDVNNVADAIDARAFNLGWRTANRWQPMRVNSSGAQFVTGENTVPDDGSGVNGVTDAVDAKAFLLGFDGDDGDWRPVSITNTGEVNVNLAGPNNPWADDSFTAGAGAPGVVVVTLPNARNKQGNTGNNSAVTTCDAAGAQFVRRGAPNPSAATITDVATTSAPQAASTEASLVKSGAADVVQVRANNAMAAAAYACIVDKTGSAPANNDAVKWPIYVPAGGSVAELFDLPLHLVNGLGLAWSSTPNVVTLVADALASSIVASYK